MTEFLAHAENSAENSVKPKRGNSDKIKPYQFKPGQSGNPGGRPKRPLSDAYRDLMDKIVPGDKEKRTFAELIALAVAKEAIKGKTQAAIEIADRVEGKSMQGVQVSGPSGGAILESLTPEQNERRIAELLAKGGWPSGERPQ
jgi:Family of unknown function (DUF5681)